MGTYKQLNWQLVGLVHPAKAIYSTVASRQAAWWRHRVCCQKVLCRFRDFTFLNSTRFRWCWLLLAQIHQSLESHQCNSVSCRMCIFHALSWPWVCKTLAKLYSVDMAWGRWNLPNVVFNETAKWALYTASSVMPLRAGVLRMCCVGAKGVTVEPCRPSAEPGKGHMVLRKRAVGALIRSGMWYLL